MAPAHKGIFWAKVVLAFGVALLLPFWVGQIGFLLDPGLYDPDTFAMFGLWRLYDPKLFVDDYTAQYYLSQWMPWGYWALHYVWCMVLPPTLLHRVLPVVLWLSCLPAVFICGKRLGGMANAYATLAIFAGSSIFIFRMVTGTEHSFAFPLTWWAVAAMLSGWPVALGVITVASALVYPFVTPVVGFMLALWLMFPGLAPTVARVGTPACSVWWKRGLWLLVPGVAALAFMAPMALPHGMDSYGALIDLRTQREAFPEAGNPLAVLNPFFYLISAYALQNSTRLGLEGGQILTLAIFGVLFISLLLHNPRDRRPGALKPYVYAVMALFLFSIIFAYDHAYRFAMFNFPVLITLFLPLGLRRVSRTLFPKVMRSAVFAVLVLGYVGCIAGADAKISGYLYRLEPYQLHAIAFLHGLPENVMIAGWPGDASGHIVEAVPYVAQRKVLVTWATHALAHTDYVLAQRAKMMAITEAYLAHDVAPLVALRDNFGVDYLVVNERDFAGGEAPLYMEPFNARAKALWAMGGDFTVLQLDSKAGVYAQDGVHVLDLHKL